MNIIQIYKRFPVQKDCLDYLEAIRWRGTPTCPYCQSIRSSPLPKENRHHCNNCNTSYSVTVGTIFHKTRLDLQRWFLAITLILNAKKGISARQLARDLEINKNTAWYMAMRIRKAMVEHGELLKGIVEMDETFIGGKPRKGGPPRKRGRGAPKTPVVGMIERGGRVKAKVSRKGDLTMQKLSALVRENVDVESSTLITDEYLGYAGISSFMPHKKIEHKKWYVEDDVHVNTLESFWALLKRGLVGQFHKVSVKHLPKYVAEFCYRHNHRNTPEIFDLTISRAVGGKQ